MSSSTPVNIAGFNEGKSPASAAFQHIRQASGQAVSSPAKMMMSSPSHANIPSPATFAKLAAAVGVQNPLEDSIKSTVSADGINSDKSQDPLAMLLASADTFLNVHLDRLERAGSQFFDEYENALADHSDPRKVVEAHGNLLALYDQIVTFAAQSGLAAIPCAEEGSKTDESAKTIDELQERLAKETNIAFEKRERLREGASMVTSILMQSQGQRLQ